MSGRTLAGQRAHARGDDWEATIRGHLAAWTARKTLLGWQQQAPLTRRVGPGGERVVIVDREGPVDFAAWSSGGAWMWEAKHTSSDRWPYRLLDEHQARLLTSWHAPDLHRYAGVALRFRIVTGGLGQDSTWWLDWGALGPMWWAWSGGDAARGGASLRVADVADWGAPWGRQVFGGGGA